MIHEAETGDMNLDMQIKSVLYISYSFLWA